MYRKNMKVVTFRLRDGSIDEKWNAKKPQEDQGDAHCEGGGAKPNMNLVPLRNKKGLTLVYFKVLQ